MRPLIFIIILLFMAVPLSAQEMTPEQKSDIALEVFQMTQSMEEMIQLLKEDRAQNNQSAELQKLQIAVEYLSFRSRRIEVKEQELREKRLSRDRMEELVDKIKDDPEQWERFDKNAQSPNPVQTSFEERPSDYRLRQLEERIDTLDSEIIQLELEVAQLTQELTEFETYVQKQLKLIQ